MHAGSALAEKQNLFVLTGLNFDAHKVDFDEMLSRLGAYKDQEVAAYQKYLETVEA